MIPQVGDIVDGWRIVGRIQGGGHSGVLYRVEYADDPALKGVLKLHPATAPASICRFFAEDAFVDGPILARHKPLHYGHGFWHGNPYYVMEEVLPLVRPGSHAELLAFARELLLILDELFKANHLHCDLKPANLGRRADGSLVILDWGCVLDVTVAARFPISAGTDHYRAPEAARGEISVLSEVYSAAKILSGFAFIGSLHRLGPALLAATEVKPERRQPASFRLFLQRLETCEASFRDTIKLLIRFWRTAIISVVIGLVCISLGFLALTMNNNREFSNEVLRINQLKNLRTTSAMLGRDAWEDGKNSEALQLFKAAAALGDKSSQRIVELMTIGQGTASTNSTSCSLRAQ